MTTNPFIPTTSGLRPNAGVAGTPGAITASSTTPQSIAASGVISMQVPAQAAWAPGMFVSVVSQANAANYMWGTVQSYSGTTLNINVLGFGGSGTYSAWYINLSGPGGGATGATGPQGPQGPAGATSGSLAAYLNGLIVTTNNISSTSISIFANAATLVNSGGSSFTWNGASVVIDISMGHGVSTADGMDGEAPNLNSPIYCYLISNGSGVPSGLATNTSPTFGPPTMPAGFTYSAYVGAVCTDGSGNLLYTHQTGSSTHFVVTPATNTAALPTMASGAAGSVTVPTWIAVTTPAFVPDTISALDVVAHGNVGGTPVTVAVAPNNSYGAVTSSSPPPVIAIGDDGVGINSVSVEGVGNNIFWASSGADGFLFLFGWKDYYIST